MQTVLNTYDSDHTNYNSKLKTSASEIRLAFYILRRCIPINLMLSSFVIVSFSLNMYSNAEVHIFLKISKFRLSNDQIAAESPSVLQSLHLSF